MPLLVNSVPNLAQGVSQQPDNLRYPGQCDEQINAWATVVEGLKKRPNTNYVKNLDTDGTANIFTHFVKRDETNQYAIVVSLGNVSLGTPAGVSAYNLSLGTRVSVFVTSIANSYLSLGTSVTDPLNDLRALTVADYTFLVNKRRTVRSRKDSLSSPPDKQALIAVKLGDYEKAYSVYIDGVLVSPSSSLETFHQYTHSYWQNHTGTVVPTTYYSGPSTGGARSGVYADTEHIAEDLATCIEDQYATTRTGIDDFDVTTGGTGWLDVDNKLYVMVRVRTKNNLGFNQVDRWEKRYVKASDPKKLEFTVFQNSPNPSDPTTTYENRSAKGFCEVSNGIIQQFIFTNKGSNYDSDTATYPLQLELVQKVYGRYINKGGGGGPFKGRLNKYVNGWVTAQNDATSLPADPTFNTPISTTTLSPLLVIRDGSLIKVQKTVIVSNGGSHYSLINPHESSAITEPGTGSEWESFWTITSLTAGATAWATNTFYDFTEDIRVRTTDGLQNQGLDVIYKEVNSITDLPARCYGGFRVKVAGDPDINQDDYFVEFDTKDGEDFGEGAWVETVGWNYDNSSTPLLTGATVELDETTMPITLKPVFNGTEIISFKLQAPQEDEFAQPTQEIGWRTRKAGNDFTNPMPTFVSTEGSFVSLGGTVYSCVNDHYSTAALTPSSATTHWRAVTSGYPVQVDAWAEGVEYGREVKKTINDVFFFKNRLGFVTDTSVIFSEADNYFNFFRTTTQQLLDSAPIDVGLSHTKVAILQHAIPFQEKLMLFSKQSQFVLRGADVLSPKTVAISPVTEYDISDSVEPVALGNYIYFTFKRNDFEGMYEYFVDNNTELFDAEEVTQQVPKYIPNNVRKIAGSQAENTLCIGVDSDLKTLYVYKYFWSNKEKIQSAWMKFTFDRDVVGFDFIDSKLYMITKDDEGLHLEFLTLEDGLTDEGLGYPLLLDSRVDGNDVTVSLYNASTKKTRISGIPYNVSLGTDIEIYTKIGTQRAITMVDNTTVDVTGALASYVSNGGTVYKCVHTDPDTQVHTSTAATEPGTGADWTDYWVVSTDFSTATAWALGKTYNDDTYFVIGKPYDMLYRFSNQAIKQPTERGGRSASDYTFQTIRNGSINYADTGHFVVEVTPEYRDTYKYVFNPDITGANLLLNEFEPQDGHFRFAVQGQPDKVTIEVKSDSALPCKLLAAEFESMVIPRSKRYGS